MSMLQYLRNLEPPCSWARSFPRSHLPKDGWLQACVFCQEITGNIHSVSKTDVSSLIKRSWSLMFPRWRTCVFISFRCAQCCSRLRRRPSLKKQYLHCVRAAIDKHFRARLRSWNTWGLAWGWGWLGTEDYTSTCFHNQRILYENADVLPHNCYVPRDTCNPLISLEM